MPDDFFEMIKTVKGRKVYIRGDRDFNVPGNPVIWHGYDVTRFKNIKATNAMETIMDRGDVSDTFSDKWKTQDSEGFTHGYPSTKAAKKAAVNFFKDLF
jgi:hypothetical protein